MPELPNLVNSLSQEISKVNLPLPIFKEKILPFNSKLKMDGLILLKSLENC